MLPMSICNNDDKSRGNMKGCIRCNCIVYMYTPVTANMYIYIYIYRDIHIRIYTHAQYRLAYIQIYIRMPA